MLLLNTPMIAALAAASPCPALPVGYIVDTRVNAWTDETTGIAVTTGMMAKTETPDELAFVIAHEMGHVCLKGGSEFEADRIGQEIVIKAGYSPEAARTFLGRTAGAVRLSRLLSFPFATHPSNEARIERLYEHP